MNILLLTHFFSPKIGGAEYVFTIIAKLLAQSGHKVWVITNRLEDIEIDIHNNIQIVYVSPPKSYSRAARLKIYDIIRYHFSAVRVGLSLIKQEKIDIIHSNETGSSIAGFTGSILAVLSSKPHVMLIHHTSSLQRGFINELVNQKGKSKFNTILRPLFERSIVKLKCSAIHTVSEFSKENLIRLGAKKKIFVINDTIEIKKKYNIQPNPFQFVYIGRLVPHKNVEVVIKSIKLVKRSFPQIKLFIIGDGPHKENLQKLVAELNLKDNIEFTQLVSEEEKNKILAMSQALVFPSLFEGFGMVILEAFSQEKPVLVSKVRPLSDIVEHKKTGLVIPPHDEKEWGKSMENILKDSEQSLKMGKAGRKTLEEKYNLKNFQKGILDMYDDLLK